jgi:hypothetical protein
MDNFQTIEVRWFYPGVLPDRIFKWFNKKGEPIDKIDTRADFYLQSQSPDLGVKLRQGNLEVKYRQQDLGKIAIDRFTLAQVEQWSKWICINDTSALHPTTIASKPGWIKVDKIRYQRLYQVEFTDTLQLMPISSPQADAAAIEITQLQVQGQTWWTLACEYLGHNIQVEQQFLPLVRSLLSDCLFPTSTSPISCGYPQWLLILQ